MPKIVLEHVTKRWNSFYAVDDLSMVIEDNAFVTLLGPSGCGKTTTLRMIAGLETPTSGKIRIGDQVVFDSAAGINVPANKRRIGFLFQNYALWPNMTVYQNIAFGLSNIRKEVRQEQNGQTMISSRKLTKAEIETAVKRVSDIVKIGMFMDRYPAELSGGQQQRVAIARTLAPEPTVLFMDEPLSNLDAKLRLEMRYELQRLHVETGSTFVYVTHDQMEAMTLATKICLINNGVLQQYAPPLTVYHAPTNLFAADFVGNPSINFVEAEAVETSRADSPTIQDTKAAGKRTGIDNSSLRLKLLNGEYARFLPNEPLSLANWHEARKSKAAEAEAALCARRKQKGYVEKSNRDERFCYRIDTTSGAQSASPDREPENTELVLGIRPEFISIGSTGKLSGEIYGAMPTGMESTVKIGIDGTLLLTAVVFGSELFKIGSKIHFDITGHNIMLFDRGSGQLMACGKLEFE